MFNSYNLAVQFLDDTFVVYTFYVLSDPRFTSSLFSGSLFSITIFLSVNPTKYSLFFSCIHLCIYTFVIDCLTYLAYYTHLLQNVKLFVKCILCIMPYLLLDGNKLSLNLNYGILANYQ